MKQKDEVNHQIDYYIGFGRYVTYFGVFAVGVIAGLILGGPGWLLW